MGKQKTNMPWKLLCLALALILAGSFAASLFHSGSGAVSISRIRFDGGHGDLSGLLYMPKDASAANPRPAVIVTHGYLNSAEMQDANAIELSRRGFVVLALDQYDHGHSRLNPENYTDTSFFGIWLPFWLHSMNDAVQYMYDQPYVLKDADGNGMIGVTGHSMGGFSTTVALAMDEAQAAQSGVKKIRAGLTEGSDFSYSAFVGVDVAAAAAAGGGRIMGKVAAQYDEFFFNDPAVEGGTVRKKNYVATPEALTWLERESAEPNTWYETADGGRRIIYQPAQTHPWNHFSTKTTAYALDFYMDAFSDCASMLNPIASGSQVWPWKECFECVALVGFVMLIIAFSQIVLALPFFSKARAEQVAVLPSAAGSRKAVTACILIVAILLPGIFFAPLMDDGAGNGMVNILFYAGLAVAACGLTALILSLVKKHDVKITVGGCFMILSGGLLALVAKTPMYQDYGTWTAPGVNSIAYWTIGCALISLSTLSTVYVLLKSRDGITLKDYGVTLSPIGILAGVCGAVVTAAASFAVLFLVDAVFKTDFRIWTFAFKTFDANIFPAVLRYLPTFLLFYLVSTAGIAVNTNTEKLQGIKGYLLAIALNAGGAVCWLALQYIVLFSTGTAVYPGSALSGIELVAMVPTLSIAAVISRSLYRKTGSIWMPGCLNALLMTIMTIANTMVAFK